MLMMPGFGFNFKMGECLQSIMEDWWDFNISSSQFEKRATETLFQRLWKCLFKVVTIKISAL